MNRSEFVDSVARRSGIPQAQFEVLTRTTLQTLAERLTAGEAKDLGEQLPAELGTTCVRPRGAQSRSGRRSSSSASARNPGRG
ncbi:hypothetical protein DLE60_02305 [Micromonospora globispora]|uniref:DUF2267 domain-containing protein n=1 Tax=Micromonospora globispora TaxID=1450148 RepID=A0A317K7R0_9ACTN|nr:hypothetical protein DLJ46_13235 [Micromonospora globispora]PWU62083.1 hypothetical protein DLE60_02305 [Micromonospora globispora]RQW94477.1 hypothetical protein DKL51_16160 [Micromonospora globispora]